MGSIQLDEFDRRLRSDVVNAIWYWILHSHPALSRLPLSLYQGLWLF